MKEAIIYKSNNEVQNLKVVIGLLNSLPDGRFLLQAKNINKRSLPQNAYLHGVVIPLVYEGLRDMGHDNVRDEVDAKKVIKSLFLSQKVVNPNTGEVITEIVRDTSDLTTVEMANFIDEVIRWAAEYLSINIPLPNEQSKLFAV